MDGMQDERYHEYMLRRTTEENKKMAGLIKQKKSYDMGNFSQGRITQIS